jgi:hypothetical protein
VERVYEAVVHGSVESSDPASGSGSGSGSGGKLARLLSGGVKVPGRSGLLRAEVGLSQRVAKP